MKLTFAILIAADCAFAAASAGAATTDDVRWINQCVSDNKGGAAEEVVLKYCTCMNNKMSDSETQSITQWEKNHVAERKACDAESGLEVGRGPSAGWVWACGEPIPCACRRMMGFAFAQPSYNSMNGEAEADGEG